MLLLVVAELVDQHFMEVVADLEDI